MDKPLVLQAAIGKHAHVQPIWKGRVLSDRVRLELEDVEPLPTAFRRMVRTLDFDLSEMALTTHALAYRYNKPITALPIPLWRRFHHSNLVCAAASPLKGPADLAGRKVGVRAYSQTTGVWVRGILQTQYGVDLDSITWVTLEDAHVTEYRDPPNVVPAEKGKGLRDMLLSGEIAAIMGERTVSPQDVRPVIPNPDEEAAKWYRETGIFPVNHVVSIKTELLARHPWLAAEIVSLFTKAKLQSREGQQETSRDPAAGAGIINEDTHPFGVEPNRRSMQMLLDFAHQQKLTPRAYQVDGLFDKSVMSAT